MSNLKVNSIQLGSSSDPSKNVIIKSPTVPNGTVEIGSADPSSQAGLTINGSGINPVGMFKNKIINGNFDIWQRGTSQTSGGYGSDDRWKNGSTGNTKTHSRQTFASGQTEVPGNPTYFSRTVVNSVTGSGFYCVKEHLIEDVKTLSGKTAVFSFYAKADAPKNIVIEFSQFFGAGGSPNVNVSSTTISLTTAWKRYSVLVSFPSIAGKTIGSSNSATMITIWFDGGSGFNSRNNSLGHQSGTFDIAQVQLEEGSIATPFEHRPETIELLLCQRYLRKYIVSIIGHTSAASGLIGGGIYFGYLRASPTVIITSVLEQSNLTNIAFNWQDDVSLRVYGSTPTSGNGYYTAVCYFDAEI